ANPARFDLPKHWERFPLSPRERAGVRGNKTQLNPTRRTTPGTVKLRESPRQSRGFPDPPSEQADQQTPAASALGQDVLDDIAVHIRETEPTALIQIIQTFVVDAKQVQNGRLEIVNVDCAGCEGAF